MRAAAAADLPPQRIVPGPHAADPPRLLACGGDPAHDPRGRLSPSRRARTRGRTARDLPALSAEPSADCRCSWAPKRSEEHTSELQSLMRISYAVFCLKKKK